MHLYSFNYLFPTIIAFLSSNLLQAAIVILRCIILLLWRKANDEPMDSFSLLHHHYHIQCCYPYPQIHSRSRFLKISIITLTCLSSKLHPFFLFYYNLSHCILQFYPFYSIMVNTFQASIPVPCFSILYASQSSYNR